MVTINLGLFVERFEGEREHLKKDNGLLTDRQAIARKTGASYTQSLTQSVGSIGLHNAGSRTLLMEVFGRVCFQRNYACPLAQRIPGAAILLTREAALRSPELQ